MDSHGKMKELFDHYENQIESQFDFEKYELLNSKEKTRVKNLFLAIERKKGEIKPCMIRDMLSLFEVKHLFFD
jgi:hypothetical protein